MGEPRLRQALLGGRTQRWAGGLQQSSSLWEQNPSGWRDAAGPDPSAWPRALGKDPAPNGPWLPRLTPSLSEPLRVAGWLPAREELQLSSFQT